MFCKCGIIKLHREIQKGGGAVKKDVKVIKGDTILKRTASGCVQRSIKRVSAYCRVSTDTEDQINSYNSQVEHYTDFIKKNKELTLAGIYAYEVITGTQVDRRIDFQTLMGKLILQLLLSYTRQEKKTLKMDDYSRVEEKMQKLLRKMTAINCILNQATRLINCIPIQ